MMNNIAIILLITAVLSIVGNASCLFENLRGITVMIHYFGLAILCIHSLLFLGWWIVVIIILTDLVVGFVSYKLFIAEKK